MGAGATRKQLHLLSNKRFPDAKVSQKEDNNKTDDVFTEHLFSIAPPKNDFNDFEVPSTLWSRTLPNAEASP